MRSLSLLLAAALLAPHARAAVRVSLVINDHTFEVTPDEAGITRAAHLLARIFPGGAPVPRYKKSRVWEALVALSDPQRRRELEIAGSEGGRADLEMRLVATRSRGRHALPGTDLVVPEGARRAVPGSVHRVPPDAEGRLSSLGGLAVRLGTTMAALREANPELFSERTLVQRRVDGHEVTKVLTASEAGLGELGLASLAGQDVFGHLVIQASRQGDSSEPAAAPAASTVASPVTVQRPTKEDEGVAELSNWTGAPPQTPAVAAQIDRSVVAQRPTAVEEEPLPDLQGMYLVTTPGRALQEGWSIYVAARRDPELRSRLEADPLWMFRVEDSHPRTLTGAEIDLAAMLSNPRGVARTLLRLDRLGLGERPALETAHAVIAARPCASLPELLREVGPRLGHADAVDGALGNPTWNSYARIHLGQLPEGASCDAPPAPVLGAAATALTDFADRVQDAAVSSAVNLNPVQVAENLHRALEVLGQ